MIVDSRAIGSSVRSPDPAALDPRGVQTVILRWEDASRAIDSALDRLHFIAAAIKKASAKQLEYDVATFLTNDDIVFRRDAASLVRCRFPAARKGLCQQLGDSIAVRRRMLLQTHRHAKRISKRRVVDKTSPAKQSQKSEAESRSIPDPEAKGNMMRQGNVPASNVTKASRPDPQAPVLKQLHLPKRPALTTVVSLISTIQEDLFEYPPPPSSKEGETWVQCPYCLMPLDYRELKKRGNKYWRHHVDDDLKPYACLFPECAEALVFFTRRAHWKSHMESVHSKDWARRVHTIIWYCDIDHEPPERFETELLWRQHMNYLDSHPKRQLIKPTKAQLDALSPRKQQAALRERFVCPLCEQIPEKIQPLVNNGKMNPADLYEFLTDHIANHIKSLSLISVPCLENAAAPIDTDTQSVAPKDSFRRLLNQGSVPQPPSGLDLLDGVSLPPDVWSTLDREQVTSSTWSDSGSAWDKEYSDYMHPENPPEPSDTGWLEALRIWKEESDPLTAESIELDPVISNFREANKAIEAAQVTEHAIVPDVSNLNSKDESGRTQLSFAAENGNCAFVSSLLEKGADIEAADQDGRTPLLWASESGHEESVLVLLDRGARIEAADQEYGRTPLSWAVARGHCPIVKHLLTRGANIEAADNSGQTPLSWGASRGHEVVVQLLVDHGAFVEASDQKYGRTPLLWAAARGHVAIVRFLLECGANIETADKVHNRTPLSWAAESGYEVIVSLLLDNGAKIEAADSDCGQTPLSFAAENGHEAVVKLLLDMGAKIEAVDDHGWSPVSWANKKNREAVVKLLYSHGAQPSKLK